MGIDEVLRRFTVKTSNQCIKTDLKEIKTILDISPRLKMWDLIGSSQPPVTEQKTCSSLY